MVEKCVRCGNIAEGHAWIDDMRLCHGDDVDLTCFMQQQWDNFPTLNEWFEEMENG